MTMPVSCHVLRGALAPVLALLPGLAAQATGRPDPGLPFPGMLRVEARMAGNPLATYAAILDRAAEYRRSPVFAEIYEEVRANYEEFLGVPGAGVRAMALPRLRSRFADAATSILGTLEPRSAVDVIRAGAAKTRIVVFGEEHHLPQTRSLYERLLRVLWECGYRVLAAETFTDAVMDAGFRSPDYRSGYYLMDPVFAAAVRSARAMGFRLVAYDTKERSPTGEVGFRDRRQAENIVERAFAGDPDAKVVVLAGRGHAAEQPAADGWRPMASVLARLTGIDPFTIYAPTMGERSDRSGEHPLYREATGRGLVSGPTILVDRKTGAPYGSESFDAYLFWPRVALRDGRPDWLWTLPARQRLRIPPALLRKDGSCLVQAFVEGDTERNIPADQVLVRSGGTPPVLVLPAGRYSLRSIDAAGEVIGPVTAEHRPPSGARK